MKKKRLHRMNSASSSSACIKRSNRQKSAILSKLSNGLAFLRRAAFIPFHSLAQYMST